MDTLFPQSDPAPSAMETAVEATIEAKRTAGLIGPEHAALIQLARELARVIAAGAAKAKTSVPQAAQQLMAALDALPSTPEMTVDDALTAAMRSEPETA